MQMIYSIWVAILLLMASPAMAATPPAVAKALLAKIDQLEQQMSRFQAASGQAALQSASASQSAKVSVIVTLDESKPIANLAGQFNSAQGAMHQEVLTPAALRTARQNAKLAKLSDGDYQQLKRFDYVPQMALTVNRRALTTLLKDVDISVAEDRYHRPHLSSSVPIVYPTQASSSYHGGNQWAVAVLDSGVDKSHPFLSGKVIAEACYSTNADVGGGVTEVSLCPGGASSSTVSGSGEPCDASLDDNCDHGTRVAGVAAGSGSYFDGVAKEGKLVSIQVYTRINQLLASGPCGAAGSCIRAKTSDIIRGLERVLELKNSGMKIAAANLSLGSGGISSGTCDEQPEKDIISSLKAAGVATIVSAGNDNEDAKVAVPACISDAIAVGSTSDADLPTNSSNVSTALDLYAPGENIYSSRPGGAYGQGSGTSFSAPHVAGAWAVIKHKSPTSSVATIESLFKSRGPVIYQSGQSNRRIDVSQVLSLLDNNSGGASDDSLVFPIRTKDGKVVMIML